MHWLLYYFLFQIIFVLFFWIFSKRKDKRYKTQRRNIPEGFVPTEEVSIDPVSQVKTRVFINPKTGDRIYIDE
jgi:hypothetical protein